MSLTILAFPFISLITSVVGFQPIPSFGLGALASIIILLIEFITRRRVWFHDPCISDWIEHPHLTFRLLGFLGILLLLFLSFLMTGFLMNSSMDQNIMRFILNRQCPHPQSSWFVGLCSVSEESPDRAVDPVAAAIRMEAAKKMYPDAQLVTCAEKTLDQKRDDLTVTRSVVIRCDQWVIGTLVRKPVSYQSSTALVMTKLMVQQDGSYAVQEWSDDSTSDAWSSIGEEIASSTLLKYHQGGNLDQIQQNLADETAQRANLFLSRE